MINEFYTQRPKQLFRFSEHRWAQASLAHGRFRLNPAGLANDDSLDDARRDNELMRQQTSDGSKVRITHLASGKISTPIGKVTYTTTIESDYLYLSFSEWYKQALYTELTNADACLVINDVESFCERVHAAVEAILPDWKGLDARVEYECKNPLGAWFTKDPNFRNQRERRFAWRPPTSAEESTYTDIEIGSLEGIAEVRTKS